MLVVVVRKRKNMWEVRKVSRFDWMYDLEAMSARGAQQVKEGRSIERMAHIGTCTAPSLRLLDTDS